MAVGSVAALALLCPHCGKIQTHDISRFTIKNLRGKERKFSCSCGQAGALLVSISRWQYFFYIPCVVCQTNHLISLDSKKIWQSGVEKIYCPSSHMELGMVGNRQLIENITVGQKDAAAKLARELSKSNDNSDDIENPSIMLEVLNKIHDIAEQGGLYCGCGSSNVEINLLGNAVELICVKCDGRRTIPAKCEADQLQAEKLSLIELIPIAQSMKSL